MLHVIESLIADLEPVEREASQVYTFGATTRNAGSPGNRRRVRASL
jgi:hypothetical protein